MAPAYPIVLIRRPCRWQIRSLRVRSRSCAHESAPPRAVVSTTVPHAGVPRLLLPPSTACPVSFRTRGEDLTNESERSPVANIKSQLKRIKTNRVATERNRAVKSELRTWIRKFREAAD